MEFTLHFDKFTPPARPPITKAPIPRTEEEKIQCRQSFSPHPSQTYFLLRRAPSNYSQQIYTDASCPNQHDVRPGNPAGWSFTLKNRIFSGSTPLDPLVRISPLYLSAPTTLGTASSHRSPGLYTWITLQVHEYASRHLYGLPTSL